MSNVFSSTQLSKNQSIETWQKYLLDKISLSMRTKQDI